jgi:hypothetical protein
MSPLENEAEELAHNNSKSTQIGMQMSTQSKILKVNNKGSDIWKIISDVDKPENWIPFLDSRQIESNKHGKHLYFPTDLAFFCQGLIAFKPGSVKPEEKSVDLVLSANGMDVSVLVVIYEDKGQSFLEVVASSVLSKNEFAQIDDLLDAISVAIAYNIDFLANLRYPRLVNDEPALEVPQLLSKSYPGMAIREIKRVTVDDGLEEAIAGVYPVVVTDYGKKFENFSLLRDFSWWKDRFGDQTIEFMDYGQEAIVNHILQQRKSGGTTISTFLDMLASNPNKARFIAKDLETFRVVGASQYIKPPKLIPEECTLGKHKFWIGTPHVRTPMHQDGSHTDLTGREPNKYHNVNFQITGRKHVVMASPSQSQFLYPAPSALTVSDTSPHILFDLFQPIDFEKFPLFAEAELFEVVLQPGELLYLPRSWWHTFYALDNTINYSALFLSHVI